MPVLGRIRLPFIEALDFVALPVNFIIEFCGEFAVGLRRDHVDCALFPDHLPDPVCVICLVRQHMLARLQVVQERLAGRRVMGLSGRQFIPDRQPVLVGKCMNLCP